MTAADWSSSTFREALVALVRRRVPEKDAEDVVQATLADAMASPTRPEDPEAARKWIWRIALNKVADYHRRARREVFDLPDVPAPAPPEGVEDLLRWAARELPSGQDAQRTFEWLVREGEGEKLESIAEGERLPPARVRQRVSRLRRHFRARWAAQAAALAALGIASVLVAIWILRSRAPRPDVPIAHDMVPAPPLAPTPYELAQKERDEAFVLCDGAKWKECLEKLDHAATLAPEINEDPDVQNARMQAQMGMSFGGNAAARDSGLQLPDNSPHGQNKYTPAPSDTQVVPPPPPVTSAPPKAVTPRRPSAGTSLGSDSSGSSGARPPLK